MVSLRQHPFCFYIRANRYPRIAGYAGTEVLPHRLLLLLCVLDLRLCLQDALI